MTPAMPLNEWLDLAGAQGGQVVPNSNQLGIKLQIGK
jgi:hypothetical protein